MTSHDASSKRPSMEADLDNHLPTPLALSYRVPAVSLPASRKPRRLRMVSFEDLDVVVSRWRHAEGAA